MSFPRKLQINAWAGPDIDNRGDVDPELERTIFAQPSPARTRDHAPTVLNLAEWWHADVGWGLVLPDDPALPPEHKAGLRLTDPPALHRLVAHRAEAPVFRYAADQERGTLTRYFPDGSGQKYSFQERNFGTARGRLPLYLLLYGTPDALPWALQFDLQYSRFVGRIDLTGAALETYVDAICDDWSASDIDPNAMTLWSVAHDAGDITELMHNAVGARLNKTFTEDADYTPTFLARDAATLDALRDTLSDTRPGLVATTSHGMTGPLHDVADMQRQLGFPVDQDHAVLDPQSLLNRWQPDGAIWYAHACCSAGSNLKSDFSNFVAGNSDVAQILTGVAQCGSMTAPLPRALLGAPSPLRAFIGHVEPTFNWTLMHPDTRQYLTKPIADALYTGLYTGQPVGMALDPCRRVGASLTTAFLDERESFNQGGGSTGTVLRLQLTALDWRSLVLIGDPAVTLHGFGAD